MTANATPQPAPGAADPGWAPPDGSARRQPKPAAAPGQPRQPEPVRPVMWPEPSVQLFRVHGGTTVIDLPMVPQPGAHVWAATLWLDPRDDQGWGRRIWQPGPEQRGFVPAAMELGDVIEFGADVLNIGRNGASQRKPQVVRWYGYVHAVAPEGLLLRGPYPDPGRAHAAAQHALLAWAQAVTPPGRRGDGLDRHGLADEGTDPAAVTPAQPPATVTVAFTGKTATVGDPRHGWVTVPAERLAAALARPPTELAALLRPHLPALGGQEPPITLAALAARHLPDHLPPVALPAAASGAQLPTPTHEVALP
jgi:hypothetical protein